MKVSYTLLIMISLYGCQHIPSSNLEKPIATEEFKSYLTEAYDYLTEQQAICEEKYQLSEYERWYYDQGTGLLNFYNGDTVKLKIKYQEVGSISKISNTWFWGWANPSLEERIIDKTGIIKEFGLENNFERLIKRKWKGDEVDGWEMTSIAAYLLKAKGAYRVPTENTFSYFIFMEIEKVNEIEDRQ